MVGFILQWKWTSNDVDRGKQKLLADQRGVAAELGPRWLPLRDKLEKWTTDLARSAGPEIIDREGLGKWDFRTRSGIYLRLRAEDAQTPEAIRTGAKSSLRDGFTACLMRVPNPSATAGKECKRTRDCPAREFCNEQDHCSKPAQPFNLRVAYRTMQILSDDWVREVQAVDAELRLRLYQTHFEDAIRDDMPLASELLAQAQYFLVVLDETPPGLALPAADAGVTANEVVQGAAHESRVLVVRLSDDKVLLRIRRPAGGELIGASPAIDSDVMAARQRQANSCALALSVREAMGDTNAATVPPQQ
ncbi:Hypothetical protein A7982_04760 [Minicystis rosea]|nr:Hypothetical protein A7982_04760 [Minicystis rosea]